MVPIDFAEHHVASEDHHFGGCFAFVRDRQRVAGFVEAQAADQPAAVEMLTVGNAGVEAVAHQVVDFVDVDGTGQDAVEDAMGGRCDIAGDEVGNLGRIETPIVAQDVGHFAGVISRAASSS